MKLIIAEKPSGAKNLAHTIGAYDRISSDSGNETAFYNDEYYVANACGHLYSLGNPTDYGYQANFNDSYKSNELPMFPQFKLYPANEEMDGLRAFLTDLINKSDVTEIINACDAGREGELIFREIYEASGSNKPCYRFWTSSPTDSAILAALENMKPMAAYDNLYRAAKARNELDWIFGMNLSRNYAVLDNCKHSVGRVVTPLLGIITSRDNEIAAFEPTTSYKILLNGFAESCDSYLSAQEVQSIIDSSRNEDCCVRSVKIEHKSENRPQLFSLSKLQQEANNRYSMTADETLKAAQSLYEKKYTTYPRTDCRVISDDMCDEITQVVEKLSQLDKFREQAEEIKAIGLNYDKRVVDNSALTDHHAIIPTDIIPNLSSLSDSERKIYELVAYRLLAALGQKYQYDEISYELWCNDITYTATVKNTVSLGWKKWDNAEIPYHEIRYTEGQVFIPDSFEIKDCITQAPKRYTDASLLSVMENIDNRMESDELKEAVKNKGIGTPSTRAEMIEKLIRTGYIERSGKQLISTQFGRDFAASLPSQLLSVERTAEWEQIFNDIETAGVSERGIVEATKEFVANVIRYEKTNTTRQKVINPNETREINIVGKCPRCGMDIAEKKDFYACTSYKSKEEKGCGFNFSKTHRQGWFLGEITPKKAEELLAGKPIVLKAKNQKGEKYDSNWELSDDGEYVNINKCAKTAEAIGKCPRCGMDVAEGKLSFGCTSYKGKDEPGCGFAIWKEDKHGGFTVTARMAKELLAQKKTTVKKKTLSGKEIIKTVTLVEREVNGRKYVNLDYIDE